MKHRDHGLSSGTMKMREDISNAQLSTPWLISKLCGGAAFRGRKKLFLIFQSALIIWLSLQNTPVKISGDREYAVCSPKHCLNILTSHPSLYRPKHWLRSPSGSLGSDYLSWNRNPWMIPFQKLSLELRCSEAAVPKSQRSPKMLHIAQLGGKERFFHALFWNSPFS